MGLTRGQVAADKLAAVVGSWKFVIGQGIFLVIWFVLNSVAWSYHWDHYPYVLANLFMSAEAAFTGPVIMMSANRAAEMDRQILQRDYLEDTETNRIVEAIAKHLGIKHD